MQRFNVKSQNTNVNKEKLSGSRFAGTLPFFIVVAIFITFERPLKD